MSRCMLAMTVFTLVISISCFFSAMAIASETQSPRVNKIREMAVQRESRHGAAASLRRTLLHTQVAGHGPYTPPPRTDFSIQRNGEGQGCSVDDIVIHQHATTPLPNGIPQYTVDILNTCASDSGGCKLGKIHMRCGWFSSYTLINPKVFRRLGQNDCLLNDGRAFSAGGSISFTYANSFSFPLSVSSTGCA